MAVNYVGLDVGGTKILAARFGVDLQMQDSVQIPTEAGGGKARVLQNIIDSIQQISNSETQAVGIGWPGFVDPVRGFVYHTPNIPGFQNLDLGKILAERFAMPVGLENDARLFALAEHQLNADPEEVVLGIIMGTGVGSGLVWQGKVFSGGQGFAGEIGHHLICPPGNQEVEDILAGPGLTNLFAESLGVGSLEDLERDFAGGRAEILDILQDRIRLLADWLYNLVLSFNPDQIVIGGGAGRHFWFHFAGEIEAKVCDRLTGHRYPVKFRLRFSDLDNAGVIGAGALARSLVKK